MKQLFTVFLVSLLVVMLPLEENRVSAYEFDTHQYKDIPENSRYNQSLMILHRQGALEDKSQQTYYYPKRAMVREDVAVMIAKAKNLTLPKSVHSFKDIKGNDAKAKYIQAVSDAGIISGYPDGTFRPNAPVERGEAAILMAKTVMLFYEA